MLSQVEPNFNLPCYYYLSEWAIAHDFLSFYFIISKMRVITSILGIYQEGIMK